MTNIKYNLQFDKLCDQLKLGKLVDKPKAISGGLLHRMYAVKTTKGKYAVKALNPHIMIRPEAMGNYINSEIIARKASKNISALPAKVLEGNSIQNIDNQYYLVFDFIDSKSLKTNEIDIVHCEKIGSILADIHKIDFSGLDISNYISHSKKITNWNFYLKKGQENNMKWANSLLEIIDEIYDWSSKSNEAEKLLLENIVISHRDLDSKNVMWNNENPIIIDWEAAGYINPMHELIEAAIYWSENEVGKINKDKFLTFINSYKNKCGKMTDNWKIVLDNGFSGKLGWLEYNLKRSLMIECNDKEEQRMGTKEVIETIDLIKRYADMSPEIEKWLISDINQ